MAAINDRYSCIFVRNREAFFELYEDVKYEERSRIILQEYIPGEDWVYHGFCDPKNDFFVSFTGKKLWSYPPVTGSTALGWSHSNETLRRQCETFLKTISYSGIVDIDLRLDVRSGQYKIVDCNPRVGQNFRMFESEAGIDVVRAQYLSLSGRNIECREMIEGRLFAVESFCVPLFLHRRDEATATLRAAAGHRELAWWCKDDPVPFFSYGDSPLVANYKPQCSTDIALRMNYPHFGPPVSKRG